MRSQLVTWDACGGTTSGVNWRTFHLWSHHPRHMLMQCVNRAIIFHICLQILVWTAVRRITRPVYTQLYDLKVLLHCPYTGRKRMYKNAKSYSSSSNMDVNTLKAESQQFNLIVILSFQIQCAGVRPKQWEEDKCSTVQILTDCTVYLRSTSGNNKKKKKDCVVSWLQNHFVL